MPHSPTPLSVDCAHLDDLLADAGLTQRPAAVVDIDAFDRNARSLTRRAAGTPIRVATKSVRVRSLIERALRAPGFRGLLCYTLREALWLAELGADDLVVAYPTVDQDAIRTLAADEHARAAVCLMIDSFAHADLITHAVTGVLPPGEQIRVAIDVDAGFMPLPGLHLGALRSPIFSVDDARTLSRALRAYPQLRVSGMMGYEGQIAGVGTRKPGLMPRIVRAAQLLSSRELTTRRSAIADALREEHDLDFCNGGGTGSIELTIRDRSVTEIGAGSGLLGSALFDTFSAFTPEPALLCGWSVVRRPNRRTATVLGGGIIATGVPGPDRAPTIHYPRGLTFHAQEGAGEVQSPVIGEAADQLRIGDTVWMRPAKAGEPAERFDHYILVSGSEVVDVVPTYRGEGRTFL